MRCLLVSELLVSAFILLALACKRVEAFGNCPSKGFVCVDETTYKKCWYFLFFAQFGSEVRCSVGQLCNNKADGDTCITTTTLAPTTLAPATTTKVTCPSKRFICKNQTAYQRCRWAFFVDFYDDPVQCNDGYICDTSSDATELCVVQEVTTTTTTVAPTPDKPFYCWILFFLC